MHSIITEEEVALIKRMDSKFKHEGLSQVYVEAKKRGYERSYGSMCRQIRRQGHFLRGRMEIMNQKA